MYTYNAHFPSVMIRIVILTCRESMGISFFSAKQCVMKPGGEGGRQSSGQMKERPGIVFSFETLQNNTASLSFGLNVLMYTARRGNKSIASERLREEGCRIAPAGGSSLKQVPPPHPPSPPLSPVTRRGRCTSNLAL